MQRPSNLQLQLLQLLQGQLAKLLLIGAHAEGNCDA